MSQTRLTKGKAAEMAEKAQAAVEDLREQVTVMERDLMKESDALTKEYQKLTAPKNWVKLEVRATTGKGEVFEVVAEEPKGFDHHMWQKMVSNAGRALQDKCGGNEKNARVTQIKWRLRQIPGEHRRRREELNKKIFRQTQTVRKMGQFLAEND